MGLFGFIPKGVRKSVRDIFDANTAEDQRKRLAAGQARTYQQQQAARPNTYNQVARVASQVSNTGPVGLVRDIKSKGFQTVLNPNDMMRRGNPLSGYSTVARENLNSLVKQQPSVLDNQVNKTLNNVVNTPNGLQNAANTGITKLGNAPVVRDIKNAPGINVANKYLVSPLLRTTANSLGRVASAGTGNKAYDEGSKGQAQLGSDIYNVGSLIYTPAKAAALAIGGKTAFKAVPGALGRGFLSGSTANVQQQLADGKSAKDLDLASVAISGSLGAGLNTVAPIVTGALGRGIKNLLNKPRPTIKATEIMDALPEEKAAAYYNNYTQPKDPSNGKFTPRTASQLKADAKASEIRAKSKRVQAKRTEMQLITQDSQLKQTMIGELERNRDMHAGTMRTAPKSSTAYKNAQKAYTAAQEEIKRISGGLEVRQKGLGNASDSVEIKQEIPKSWTKQKVTLKPKDVKAIEASVDGPGSARPEFDMKAANKVLDRLADDPVAYRNASESIQKQIDKVKAEQIVYDKAMKQAGMTEQQIQDAVIPDMDLTNDLYKKPKVSAKPKVAAKMNDAELASLDATQKPTVTAKNSFVDQWNKGLPQAKQPKVSATPRAITAAPVEQSRLGSMADDFYQGAKGDKKISYNHLKDLGDKISAQIDSDFKAIGSNFEGVARKVQDAADAGVRKLDDVDLTPQERDLVRKAQAEMNYVRRRASLGRKQTDMGDLGEMYLPQQRVGDGSRDSLFDGFMAKKPGNEYTRKGLIDPAERDYSSNTVGGYVTRYADTKLTNRERILRAVTKDNPNVEPTAATQAADKIAKLQDEVNNLETSIGLGGLGRRRTRFEGKNVDFVERMNEVGQDLGHQQTVVTDVPRGLTNGDKINSVKVGDEILADNLGLNQHRDAGNYASSATTHADGDRELLAATVENRLKTAYKMDPEDIAYTVDSVRNIGLNVPEEVVLGRVEGVYRNAAKQQMLRQLQDVGIKDKGLRKVVSDLASDIVREGSIEQKTSATVVRSILKAQNAIFRKFNVSSALNELGDLPSFLTAYGKKTSLIPDFNAVREFGLGEIDAAIEPFVRQLNEGVPVNVVIRGIKGVNRRTNLYKFVEAYKAGVVAHSAKKFYANQGLTGDALTQAVVRDYRSLALPVDGFTKTFLDNAPLYTQYMGWGARNLQKEGRLAAGTLQVGKLTDMSRQERIARNAYTNLPAKTTFWLASNGLKGTAILTAFGLTDFTGLSNQDFSGIQEEDKSLFDKTTQVTNSSTTLSMLNTIVQSLEKEQLKEKYKDADYNPYEKNDVRHDLANKFTPQAYRNYDKANKLYDQGYAENKAGKVQYEASDDFGQKAKAFVLGPSTTDNAREASGRQDIATRIKSGQNPLTAIKDMALEDVGAKDTNYKRPINEDYSKAYKIADKGARTALLQGGRQYNAYLDDLKKTNKPAYDNYISTMDGNHVNPEFWKKVGGKDGTDLTVFKSLQARKRQLSKDLKKPYDPIYDLPDDQARAVMQQKATATGDDIALRNSLYKLPWYKDYVKKTSAYYDKLGEKGEGGDQTKRVKDWYAYETKLNDLSDPSGSWAKQYPTVNRQKQITEKYGFDSQESKTFFKQYGDAYKAEKAKYDQGKLALINEMRKIEGFPEMTSEQYAQVTKIADTDGDTKKYADKAPDINTTKGMNPTEFVKSKKVAFKKPSELKKVKLTAAKLTKAKVTSRKSLV